MAKEILSDELWRRVELCLPAAPFRRRVPGPQPIEDRSVLVGILFVLKTGLPWEELPVEMGAGSGMTCLRRLRQWQQTGVWRRIRNEIAGAFDAHEIDWKRAEWRARSGRRRATAARLRPRGEANGRRGATRGSGLRVIERRVPVAREVS